MEILKKKLPVAEQEKNVAKYAKDLFGCLCFVLDADDNRSAIMAVEASKALRKRIEYGEEPKEIN